jgi:site-specific DNA-methyltransferase (adenine-specific)
MKSEVHLIDCMEFMRSCKDKQFDLAVVDPPYGINVNESIGRYKGQKHSGHKKAVWDSSIPNELFFSELFRVSKNQIIWGGNYFNLPPCRCFIIWDKLFSDELTFSMYEFAWSSFYSMSKGFKYNPAMDRPKQHPTQKPVALYDWIFRNYAKPNDTILDTHMGSQSSRISAYKAGLDFTGCELDPEYFEQGNERFKQFLLKYGTPDPTKAIQGQQINLF